MRTTIELSRAVASAASALARDRNTTLDALVEEGLWLLVERHAAASAYVLPDLSYGSGGLVDELAVGAWALLRDRAYEDRS